MDTEARQQLAGCWQGVAQRTGQPFTNASLEQTDGHTTLNRRAGRW
jgi:protein-disulfide isomerase-like protein with CxxC motif